MTRLTPICAEADLAEGRARRFPVIHAGRNAEGFVARHHGRLVAFVNRCRHLPLSLDYGDAEFFSRDGRHLLCKTHGALYEPSTGLCVRGPCEGDHLIPLEIAVQDGVICLVESVA